MVAVSCCNNQPEMLILDNKPIRLQESYTMLALSLCRGQSQSTKKNMFSLTLIIAVNNKLNLV